MARARNGHHGAANLFGARVEVPVGVMRDGLVRELVAQWESDHGFFQWNPAGASGRYPRFPKNRPFQVVQVVQVELKLEVPCQ